MDKKVKTPCPFHGRPCLKEDCSFNLNHSEDVHQCCQMQRWLDVKQHRQLTFNQRINELWTDAGGYNV